MSKIPIKENEQINKGLEQLNKEPLQYPERLYKALPSEIYIGVYEVLKKMPYEAVQPLINLMDSQVKDVTIRFIPEKVRNNKDIKPRDIIHESISNRSKERNLKT